MTQVEAIPVEIIIEGSYYGKSFYTESHIAYGKTIGEVMDNMVKKSLKISENVQLWMMQTQSADYSMSKNLWTLKFRLPAMTPGFYDDSETENISSLRDIVASAVCVRSTYLQSTYNQIEDIALSYFSRDVMPIEMRDDLLETHKELSLLEDHSLTLKSITNVGVIGKHFDAVVSLIPVLPKSEKLSLKRMKKNVA